MTTLVPAAEADREFLFQVYAASRDSEMAVVPWTDDQKQLFLRMQFDLQDRHYRSQYSQVQFLLVVQDGRPIGRLYLYETAGEIHVMDISLLPAFRGGGVGGAVMRDLLARAAESARAVTLYVEHHNPARRLYQRLGFREAGGEGVYLRMECMPNR